MKRVMVVLELEGGEAVVVHSKELMQHKEWATAEMIAMYPDLYRKQQELQVKNDLEIN